jgi:hypothetical protein
MLATSWTVEKIQFRSTIFLVVLGAIFQTHHDAGIADTTDSHGLQCRSSWVAECDENTATNREWEVDRRDSGSQRQRGDGGKSQRTPKKAERSNEGRSNAREAWKQGRGPAEECKRRNHGRRAVESHGTWRHGRGADGAEGASGYREGWVESRDGDGDHARQERNEFGGGTRDRVADFTRHHRCSCEGSLHQDAYRSRHQEDSSAEQNLDRCRASAGQDRDRGQPSAGQDRDRCQPSGGQDRDRCRPSGGQDRDRCQPSAGQDRDRLQPEDAGSAAKNVRRKPGGLSGGVKDESGGDVGSKRHVYCSDDSRDSEDDGKCGAGAMEGWKERQSGCVVEGMLGMDEKWSRVGGKAEWKLGEMLQAAQAEAMRQLHVAQVIRLSWFCISSASICSSQQMQMPTAIFVLSSLNVEAGTCRTSHPLSTPVLPHWFLNKVNLPGLAMSLLSFSSYSKVSLFATSVDGTKADLSDVIQFMDIISFYLP